MSLTFWRPKISMIRSMSLSDYRVGICPFNVNKCGNVADTLLPHGAAEVSFQSAQSTEWSLCWKRCSRYHCKDMYHLRKLWKISIAAQKIWVAQIFFLGGGARPPPGPYAYDYIYYLEMDSRKLCSVYWEFPTLLIGRPGCIFLLFN